MAQLLLVYLKCLPEPLLTFSLFRGITAVGGSDIHQLSLLLRSLPTANLKTLHTVLFLLYRVAENADANKVSPALLQRHWQVSSAAEALAGEQCCRGTGR